MDRRRSRFVPSAEGLEVRRMLSTASAATTPAAPNLPEGVNLATYQQKVDRIERLPFFLQSLNPDVPLPDDLTESIQANLNDLKGKLHQAPSSGLNAFNVQVRGLISQASVPRSDAAKLNELFGEILIAAGAPESAAEGLQEDMNELTQIDTTVGASNVTSVVANSYGLVLQIALAVGRPLRAPTVPRLVATEDTGRPGDYTTSLTQPRLVGNYDAGTAMRILDESDNVLGTAAVGANGQFIIGFNSPLSVGKHRLHLQAVDSQGALSLPSRDFTLTIVTPPRGPRVSTSKS